MPFHDTANPTRRLIHTALIITCTVAVAATAWWAVATPSYSVPVFAHSVPGNDAPNSQQESTDQPPPQPDLFLKPFDTVRLWHEPAAPPTVAQAPPPKPQPRTAPPSHLQLISIIHGYTPAEPDSTQQTQQLAVLYDTRENTIIRATIGQEFQGWRLSTIEKNNVQLTHSQQTYDLTLVQQPIHNPLQPPHDGGAR